MPTKQKKPAGYWEARPVVEVWQGLCLARGIEPPETFEEFERLCADENREFGRLYALALEAIEAGELPTVPPPN